MAMLELSMSMHIDTDNGKALKRHMKWMIEAKKPRCVFSDLYSTEMLELCLDIVLYS